MSFNEERILILKMLEEGKITAEEAAKLIEALEKGPEETTSRESNRQNQSKQDRQANFYDEVSKIRDRINDWKKDFKKNYNQNDFDRMMDDFAAKAEKLGKNLANTTFGIVEKIIDVVGSFVDTTSFNIFGGFKPAEKTFDIDAISGMDLYIEGVNGYIVVKKHLENKIVIKSKVRSPLDNADKVLALDQTGNKLSLSLNKIGNISVSHEVFLPALKFNSIRLETSNGKIYAEDSISTSFECITKNNAIDLTGVCSEKVSVNTKNARVQLSYVIGKDIEIRTVNSVIDLKNIKAGILGAVTTNGKIFAENVQNFENVPEISVRLRTTNGDIKLNMNDMNNKGYKIRGQTTNGSINLLIPELIYHNINKQGNGGSFVEAESNGYSNFFEKVNIDAQTVNGYIEIVK